MTALRTTQMPGLSAELRGIDTGYRAAKPCMLMLLDRIAHINETVVALPNSIAVRNHCCLSADVGAASVR